MAANTDKFMLVGTPGTATTLSAPGYTISDVAINVGSTTNWPTTTGVIFGIDNATIVDGEEVRTPGSYCVFAGTVNSATSINNLTLLNGTPQNYAAGALTRVYITVSSLHTDRLVDGLTTAVFDQDGTMKAGAVDNAAALASSVVTTAKILDANVTKAKLAADVSGTVDTGWSTTIGATTVPAPNTVTCNGNRSYDLVFNSTNLTTSLSAGMRLKLTRTVTAPTQCTDLESGSSQYFSKTTPNKLTFTDDYTVGAWIKPESYVAGGIIARRNADVEGWSFGVNASGQVVAWSGRIAANNSSTTSYQSVPLNKWVHVAATIDLSGTSVLLYIDGVLVPSLTTITGTITALVQGTTALVVGAEKSAGTNPFDGKIAQAFVATGVISAANIRTLISQGLTAALITTFSVQSAYSFDNSIADLNTTTPNDLTAQAAAVATNADSPFGIQADGTTAGTTDYAIITKTAFSTNTTLTVQVPEGNAIPTSGGVSAVSYSGVDSPYGLPKDAGKWQYLVNVVASLTSASVTSAVTFNVGGLTTPLVTLPIAAWKCSLQGNLSLVGSTSVAHDLAIGLSQTSITLPPLGSPESNTGLYILEDVSTITRAGASKSNIPFSVSAATQYYLIGTPGGTGVLTAGGVIGSSTVGPAIQIIFDLAYL